MLIEAGITLKTPSEDERGFRQNTMSIEEGYTIKTRSVRYQVGNDVDRGGNHSKNTFRNFLCLQCAISNCIVSM